MDIPRNKIKSLGKPYFNDEFIKQFIATIERIAPNPDKFFLQLIQKDNKPTLEYGCKAGHILFDATASSEKKTTCVSPFSAANSIILSESTNSTQLNVMSSGEAVMLTYTAVADDSRRDLREYAEFLQVSRSRK